MTVFQKHTTDDYSDPLPGIKQKTLVFGERTLMTEVLLAKNSMLPDHAHPYEQTGHLVQGHILLRIGDAECDATAGASWCIPSNVKHGARTLEDSIAIEVFSPARTDYLPKKK
jgi:quercetin dioxygenase-like cupin family protein